MFFLLFGLSSHQPIYDIIIYILNFVYYLGTRFKPVAPSRIRTRVHLISRLNTTPSTNPAPIILMLFLLFFEIIIKIELKKKNIAINKNKYIE